MKKNILFLLLTILCLSACSSKTNGLEESSYIINDNADTTVSIVDGSVTSESLSMEISYNGSLNNMEINPFFYLECYEDGKWYTLNYLDTYNSNALQTPFIVEQEEPKTVSFYFKNKYGTLPSGTYRVIVICSEPNSAEGSNKSNITASFEIE